jgi:Holliday junction resolvase RusA-like endonuclease
MKFTIPLPPKAQKRARSRAVINAGKAFSMIYKDKGQRLEEDKFIALLYQHRPEMPFDGPILLGVRAYLPIPGSKPKKFKAAAQAGEIRPTTKPDLDNLLKHFKDCCKGIFWIDDKQVVGYLPETGKYYGFPARWEIEIKILNLG